MRQGIRYCYYDILVTRYRERINPQLQHHRTDYSCKVLDMAIARCIQPQLWLEPRPPYLQRPPYIACNYRSAASNCIYCIRHDRTCTPNQKVLWLYGALRLPKTSSKQKKHPSLPQSRVGLFASKSFASALRGALLTSTRSARTLPVYSPKALNSWRAFDMDWLQRHKPESGLWC